MFTALLQGFSEQRNTTLTENRGFMHSCTDAGVGGSQHPTRYVIWLDISTYTIISFHFEALSPLSVCKGRKAILFSSLSLRKWVFLSPWKHLTTPKTIWYTGQFVRRLIFCDLLHRRLPRKMFLYLYKIHEMHIHWDYPWDLINSFLETDILFFSADTPCPFIWWNSVIYLESLLWATYVRWLMTRSWSICYLILLMFQKPFLVWFNDFSFMCVFMTLLQAAKQLVLACMVWGLLFPKDLNLWSVIHNF